MLTIDFNACTNLVDLFSKKDDLSPKHTATETLLNKRREIQEKLLSITDRKNINSAVKKATQDLAEALFTWQHETGAHWSVFFPKIDAIKDGLINKNDKDTIAKIDAIRTICNFDLANVQPLSMYEYGLKLAENLVNESNAQNDSGKITLKSMMKITAPEQSQYSNPQKTEIMVKRYIEKILNHDISAHALYSISEEAEQIIRNESESVK
ncbi:MAG: hypothetical protein DBX47_07355 [Clostridiales bacterium]|nr:MAG: hypothetical protein DBX47_07355 [Clostridiales bacterium]